MNTDNIRLKEIQILKHGYGNKLTEAETIEDCLILQGKIDELEEEEIQILKRCDVEI